MTEPKAPEKPPKPKPRSALLPLIAGIVALIVIAGDAWYFLAGNRTAPVANQESPTTQAAHPAVNWTTRSPPRAGWLYASLKEAGADVDAGRAHVEVRDVAVVLLQNRSSLSKLIGSQDGERPCEFG